MLSMVAVLLSITYYIVCLHNMLTVSCVHVQIHQLVEQADLAPKMHACEHLPNGRSVVHLGEGWQTLSSVLTSQLGEEQQKKLREVVSSAQTTFHNLQMSLGEAAVKKALVHGDMRPPNVMVQQVGDDFAVRLIDWDWAGVDGESRYQLRRLNRDIKWHSDVDPCAVMRQVTCC